MQENGVFTYPEMNGQRELAVCTLPENFIENERLFINRSSNNLDPDFVGPQNKSSSSSIIFSDFFFKSPCTPFDFFNCLGHKD